MSGTKSVSPGGVKVVVKQLAPQANADTAVMSEDGFAFVDVLGNDLGGAAKQIWSLNQGDLSVHTTYGDSVVLDGGRLLARIVEDPARPGYYGVEVSENPDGPGYDYLAAGQTQDVVFSYSIRLANGAISTSTVTITVTGVNDAPTVDAAEVETGGVTERADGTAGENTGNLTAEGSFAFADVDLADSHTVSVTGPAGALGSLQASVADAATGDGQGSIGWTYTVAAGALDDLAAGETKTEAFDVTVSDGKGGSVTKTVTITLTGTNDAPSVSSASASVNELAGQTNSATLLTAGGSLAFTDVDLSDIGHTATTLGVVLTGSTSGLASLTQADLEAFLSLGTVTKSSGTASGDVAWSFGAADRTFDYLGAGESVTLTYTVQVNDGDGGLGTGTVSITVNGAAEPILAAALPSAFTGAGDPSDTVTATAGSGGPGNNNDTIIGTASGDILSGGQGNDLIIGRAGNDSLDGGNQDDILYGGEGDDTLLGDNQNDQLFGGSGADSLVGGSQNDTLIGGFGADTLTGSDGADIFRYLDARDTNDVITDFTPGTDKIDFSALYSGTLGFQAAQSQAFTAAHNVAWFQTGGNTVVIVDLDGNTANAELMITLTGLKNLQASDFML